MSHSLPRAMKKSALRIDLPLELKDLHADDTFVLVLGNTGSGRSTFINYAVGNNVAAVGEDIDSMTVSISPYIVHHPHHSTRRFILVDTPGFDTLGQDSQILERLVKWLKNSFPPGSQRIRLVIIYLETVGQQLTSAFSLASKVFRMNDNWVIATTKRGLLRNESGRLQETKISCKICPFRDTCESAWEIIDSVNPNSLFDVTSFQFERIRPAASFQLQRRNSIVSFLSPRRRTSISILNFQPGRENPQRPTSPPICLSPSPLSAGSVPNPDTTDQDSASTTSSELVETSHTSKRDKNKRPKEALKSPNAAPPRWRWPGSQDKPFRATDAPLETKIVARLDEISARLKTAFNSAHEYKQLLSSHGPEAQALLDTFQLILTTGLCDGPSRRNFIVATKRLSAKTDLYPGLFVLKDVQQLDKQPIAAGGYADIHRGLYDGKPVCIKIIRCYQGWDRVVKIIAREAILWGQLSHPNLLPFLGLYEIDKQFSLVSPWAEKGNIREFIKGNPDVDRVLLCLDVAGGVKYLHDNDIVHGDLKGENILVDRSFRAYVADFGLSAVEDPDILFWNSQSAAASVGGTERWKAPELFEHEIRQLEDGSEETVNPKNTKATDIWAWACVCYEIFMDRFPFFEYPQTWVIADKIRAGVRPMRRATLKEESVTRGLTEDMWKLMNGCWEKDPTSRPGSAEVLAQLAAMKREDSRPTGEWSGNAGPAVHNEAVKISDTPLTLSMLNSIILSGPYSPEELGWKAGEMDVVETETETIV